MSFLAELKRRKVVRVGIAYAVAAFIVLQVADLVIAPLGLPPWAMTLVVVLAALGFVPAVLLAWAFEWTAAGVRRETPSGDAAPESARPQGAQPERTRRDSAVAEIAALHSAPARLPAAQRAVVIGAVVVLAAVGGAFVTLRSGDDGFARLDPAAVVVLPFRVAADPSLAYLGEGMMDLLAAKFTGDAGPHAVDSRAVLREWERASDGGAAPLDREGALRLARSMAAGQLLLGEVVGSPGRLTVSATLHDVAQRTAGPPVSVTGAADSLPWLVDRLVAGLLSVRAGEDGARLALLTSASLPALRAYLAGKQAYRGGRFTDAAAHFRRAVEIDSTFALAGLELILAGVWTDGTPVELGRRVAWQGRDRLTPRDRRRLELGNLVHLREQLDGWEALVRERPDDAESWLELGERLLHGGPDVGMPDAFERALHAFERAVAIDSIYAPALYHAIEIYARNGDSVRVRRLADIYFHSNAPESGYHSYIGWRTALALNDQHVLGELRSTRFANVPYFDLWYIVALGQTDALPLEDVRMALAAAEQRAATSADRTDTVLEHYQFLLNAGRPAAAERVRAAARGEAAAPDLLDVVAVRAGTFQGGDDAAADAAAVRLAGRVAAAVPPGINGARDRLRQLCALEERRLAAGDASRTAATIASVEAIVAGAASADNEPHPREAAMLDVQGRLCSASLAAWHSSLLHHATSPEVAAGLATLESILSSTAWANAEANVGNVIAARLHEARGDVDAALRAVRRRSYYATPAFLATLLHEEARLAELAGDPAGARRARAHYLHLQARSR
jgi:hypothetical protein